MCIGQPKAAPQAQSPAPPPPPPADTPNAPILNEASASAKSGAQWNAAQRRGTNALKIDLATPGMTGGPGNGLAII